MNPAIRQTCASVASQVFRNRANSLASGEDIPQNWIERLISDNLIQEAASQGNHSALRNRLANYWRGSAGDHFYETYSDRFNDWFLGPHYEIVGALKKIVAQNPSKYDQLFEIGCGDGQVLNHLSQTLPQIPQLTGIDINNKIIERNSGFYLSDRVNFASDDAYKWLNQNAKHGSIVLTYGGVLEYFLEEELVEIFTMLRAKSPVAISLVEPLYDEYDLERETKSRTSGQEHSFSHNYPKLLADAGYDIVFQKEPEMEFRWIMILAEG